MTSLKPSRQHWTCDKGAAAVLTLWLALLGLGVGATALGLTLDLAMTAARARSAADAAALAAAATSPLVQGAPGAAIPQRDAAGALGLGDARLAADQIARANGAELQDIDLRGWPLRVSVRVAVAPRTQMVRSLVGMSEAGATAGVRPSARQGGGSALPLF